MASKRESSRVKDQRVVLDEVARQRRARKVLASLEQDNFHDDPHADLVMHKKLPKFEEDLKVKKSHKRAKTGSLKQRVKKTFAMLLEEEELQQSEVGNNNPTYLSASVPSSKFPPRHFCSVCGFASNYTCVKCGARYCCIKCDKTHQDTRCLKWTA